MGEPALGELTALELPAALMICTFVMVALCALASAQTVPIPARPDGYALEGFANTSAEVQIDAYYDLMCPDSKASWPVVKEAISSFSSAQILFRFHTFPLPYHDRSYHANWGATITHTIKQDSTDVYTWMEAVYANQVSFGNSETANLSTTEVNSMFGKLAESSVSIPPAQFVSSFGDPNLDEDTRVSWKLACARGVSGTPTYFINGARSSADESWTVTQWKNLLNQLIG